MRVISGSARGSKLFCPEGPAIRPTHDRVKEALFSMLGMQVARASVLDLFAGTGALGIEALSRGASSAVFVDVSPASLKVVEDNLNKTHLDESATLINSDFSTYLANTNEKFDLIFIDPPYSKAFLLPALKTIAQRKLLNENGIIYCETDTEPPAELTDWFCVHRDKKYGRARILLLKEMLL